MVNDWCDRYARVGSIVMLLHDPSDVFLEGAKLCNYADWDLPATTLFAGLLVSWLALRLVLLPFWVVRSCLCVTPSMRTLLHLVAPHPSASTPLRPKTRRQTACMPLLLLWAQVHHAGALSTEVCIGSDHLQGFYTSDLRSVFAVGQV